MALLSGGVAFFDSGIGGLTVLQTCLESLKGQTIYYYGDNARAPYGNLSTKTILGYVEQAFDTFADLQVKAAVLACNTVTALCIQHLRERYSFPIVGAEPAIFPAAQAGGEILVLCTQRTAESERLRLLKERAEQRYPNARITIAPCPSLAKAIEQSPWQPVQDVSALLPKQKADGVVLGCTHYIYYKKYIQQFYNCPVFDGNQGIQRQLSRILAKNRDERPLFSPNDENKPEKDLSPWEKLKNITQNPENCTKNVCLTMPLFLGSGQENNENVYKQMFGFNKNV